MLDALKLLAPPLTERLTLISKEPICIIQTAAVSPGFILLHDRHVMCIHEHMPTSSHVQQRMTMHGKHSVELERSR